MTCLKGLFTCIFLCLFLMAPMGHAGTRPTGKDKKASHHGERPVPHHPAGTTILNSRGELIPYPREQSRFQVPQEKLLPANHSGNPARPLAQGTGTLPTWSYAAFGKYFGYFSMFVGNVGGRREVYFEDLAGLWSGYWHSLYYNKSTGSYETGFVSPVNLIRTFRLENIIGGSEKEIVGIRGREGIFLYDQATKKLLKEITVTIGPDEYATAIETADVDNDGQIEFIMSTAKRLYVFSSNGALEWDIEWNIENDRRISDIVVGQMDNDSGLEIAATGYNGDSIGLVIDCTSRNIQWTQPEPFGVWIALADIDNDNRDELVGKYGSNITAYDVERQLVKWTIAVDVKGASSIYLDDIDNDSVVELLVNCGGTLIAYDTVTLDKEWSISANSGNSGGAKIQVADMDGDGQKEVMWGKIGGTFYIANWKTGRIEWQNNPHKGNFLGPECGDLDGDGEDELVVISYNPDYYYPYTASTHILVFNKNGQRRAISQLIFNNDDYMYQIKDVKLYDVDRDGKLEILVARHCNGAPDILQIYDFNADDTFTEIWTDNLDRSNGYHSFASITAGDVDGDGQLEIVSGAYYKVVVYDYNSGDEEWRSSHPDGKRRIFTTVKVSDVDNDGDQEIIGMVDEGNVYIFNGRTKNLDATITGSYTALAVMDTNQTPPVIALGDKNGYIELLSYSEGAYQTAFKKKYGSTYIEGISEHSTPGELIFGTDGTLNIASPNRITWTSANYGPTYGKRAVIPNGSSYIFTAGTYSVNSFKYKQKTSITVTRPNGGEEWVRGTSQTISWNSTRTVGNVKIEYSTNNGGSWSTIKASTTNGGSYTWTVPDAVSEQCLVRVSEAGGSVSDTGNGVFSITSEVSIPPEIALNRGQLNFSALESGAATGEQKFTIANNSGGILEWTVSDDASWLTCTPTSGTGYGVITVSVNHAGLAAGNYIGTISVSDPEATNSPQSVTVNLTVKNASQAQEPFGEFATPGDAAEVSGSIPVTGWALDDLEVKSVKIYSDSDYIGDAVFVEGARTDLEQIYPGYPNVHMAGWGYMLLTNFLPGGGNGTYTLSAKAVDKEGNEVTLGTRVIVVDNANAVEPFGAIDTPVQGGTASGNKFVNWGWALTPLPNTIPTDGSTIKVWIDGFEVGNPTYNINRSDIAGLFPGYNNSAGAAGHFTIDTTEYKNGKHIIYWTAEDNAGNAAGIGSRYFNIENLGSQTASTSSKSNRKQSASNHFHLESNADITAIPMETSTPVRVKKGFLAGTGLQPVNPSPQGVVAVELKELERVEVHLSPGTVNVSPLPVGSHLDIGQGVFYWQPGPGFLGSYPLDFVKRTKNGEMTRQTILINIIPKY